MQLPLFLDFLTAIQHDGDRAVIMYFNLHIRLKSPGGHLQAGGSRLLHKAVNQLIRLFGRGGSNEAGSPPFSGIGQERELADDEQFGIGIKR